MAERPGDVAQQTGATGVVRYAGVIGPLARMTGFVGTLDQYAPGTVVLTVEPLFCCAQGNF